MELAEISLLLDEFSRLPKSPQVERTILEIAGYAHYENVASNILAFFLDPNKGHGLEQVVLRSLLEATGETNAADADLDVISVQREASTESGRIDLLVETSALMIGIENKIFAGIYNDLGDYAAYIKGRAATSGKEARLVLLTLDEVGLTVDLAGFQPVVYDQFIDRLLCGIGPLLPGANPRYVSYLMDFVRTVQNLRRPEVPSAIREFVRDNAERLAGLLREIQSLREEIERKLREVFDRVNAGPQPGLHEVTRTGLGGQEWQGKFVVIRWWEISLPDRSTFSVDLRLGPRGWEVVALRNGGADVITKLLAANGIETGPWTQHRRLCGTFDYDADPSDVATRVELVLRTLRRPPDAPE